MKAAKLCQPETRECTAKTDRDHCNDKVHYRWPVSGSASLATDATLATATTTRYRVPLLAGLAGACHCFSLAGTGRSTTGGP